MYKTALAWLRHALVVVAAAALVTACADEAPIGPDQQGGFPTQLSAAGFGAVATGLNSGTNDRAVDLGACQRLRVPVPSKLAFRVYAKGVQIHRWNGTSWTLLGPSAVLSADTQGKSTVGTHYFGPTWESNSGGTVVGTVLDRCTPDPNAIPWLLLAAVSQGPGVFHRVEFIQRVNTVGGIAPSNPGSSLGEMASVPYTTEYLFYRAR